MARAAKRRAFRHMVVPAAAACLLVLVTSAGAQTPPENEEIGVADATTVASGQVVSISEGIGVGDGTSSVAGEVVSVSEGIGVGDGTDTLTGQIVDIDEGIGVGDETDVEVEEVTPVVLLTPLSGDEGSPTTGSGSFSDPDSTSWTATVSYGDGSPDEPLTLQPDGSFALSHVYDDDGGAYVVTVSVTDVEGNTGTATAPATVANVAPTAVLADAAGAEGAPVTVSFAGEHDPSGADTAAGFTYRYACDGATLGPETASASVECTFDDDGTYTVLGRIADKDGGSTDTTAEVTVENVAPTGELGNDGPVAEGSPATVSWSGVTDPSAADTAAGLTYRYACDGTTLGPETSDPATTCTFDDDGTHTVLARVADKDGGFTDRTTEVVVENAPPDGTLGNDGPVAEGSPATISWSGQSDPSAADTAAGFTYRYACDGTNLGPETTDPTASCTFDDGPATHTVLARILDRDGGATDRTTEVSVTNVAPTATLATPSAAVDEGSAFTLSLAGAHDPSAADTAAGFTVEFDCGTGAGFGPGATCVALDDPSQAVRARIADKDGGETILSADVAVANVAPTVTITGPPAGSLYRVGEPVTFTGTFTDPGVEDTHTAVWSLGIASHPGTVVQGAGSGSTTLTTSFTQAGVYPVTLTVTDDDGGEGSATTVDGMRALVVVYDPSAGFVTGGGWILSPPGALLASPDATGKATFGFVAKYKPGAKAPDGNTEFRFHAGRFDFTATAYDWLVVADSKAQYRGEGQVNGETGYRFLLTAHDGTPDRLRLKVWEPGGEVVYDNRRGSSDDIDLDPQALGGGSIVVHRK